MTQKVNPSPFRPAEAFKTAGSIYYNSDENNFIVDKNNPTEISSQDSSIDETQFSAFDIVSSNSSFNVTIKPGEAFVFGSWFAIDTSTTVTVDNNTTNQTIYAGWDKDSSDNVIIGLDSAFSTTASNNDQRIKLFDVDTDGSGVTSTTDVRKIGSSRKELAALFVAEELGIPVYSDSSNAPQSEGNIIIIDGTGSQVAGLYSHNGNSYVKTGKTTETIEDIVAAMLTAGTDIDINYNDSNSTLTINNTAGYTDEDAQDATASALSGGSNVSITYDDNNDTISIDTSALDSEEVENQVNSLLSGGTGITTSYDDAANTLTISGFDGDHASLSNVLSDQHHTRYSDEEAQDAVGNITSGGNNVSVTYDDTNDNLTIDTSALNSEEVEDQVNSLLTGGAGISLNYDDTNNTLSISNTDTDDYTDEDAQDATASALSGGSNVSITYDDNSDTITINTSALDSEEVEDQVNSLLNDGAGISLNYDDANNRLTITGFDGDHASLSNVLSDQHHTRYSDEEAQDAVGNITSGGNNVSVTYDDTNDNLTIDTSALNSEEVEDQVNSLLTGGAGISLNYDDTNDTLTISNTATDNYTDEDAQDATASALSGGSNVSITYDDNNDTITIDTSALDGQAVDDRVDRLLAAGTGITLTYDDTADTLAISAFDGDHASLSNVLSDQHHTKTSSASDLTDVSADSVTNAHHSKYTDESAQDAVGNILNTDFNYDDAGNTISLSSNSVTIEGNSVSLGGSTSVNHNDLSTISSDDHHSKTSSASDLTNVSSDSISDAHHSKTSNAYELTDVSADSVTDAHHAKYTDENAQDAVGNILNTDFNYDDVGNTISLSSNSVTIEGNSVSLGGSTSVNHNDLSTISSDDHHSKYTDENAQDAVGNMTFGGVNVNVAYDDASNTLTINTSALDSEEVDDKVNSLLNSGAGISLNYDDATDTLTISGFDGDHASLSNVLSDQHHSKTTSASDLTDVSADSVTDAHHAKYTDEDAQDAVGNIMSGSEHITVTYGDAGDSITIGTNVLTDNNNWGQNLSYSSTSNVVGIENDLSSIESINTNGSSGAVGLDFGLGILEFRDEETGDVVATLDDNGNLTVEGTITDGNGTTL